MSDKVYMVYEGDPYGFEPDQVTILPRMPLARKYVSYRKRMTGHDYEIVPIKVTEHWTDRTQYRLFTVGINWNPENFPPDMVRQPPPADLDMLTAYFRGEEVDPWSYREVYDNPADRDGGYFRHGGVSFHQRPHMRKLPIFSLTASSSVSYDHAKSLVYDAWAERYYDEVMKMYEIAEQVIEARRNRGLPK